MPLDPTANASSLNDAASSLEEEYIELDLSLYTPSLQKSARLSAKRRLFNPAHLPYIGFFFWYWLVIPVCFNFFQTRRWLWLLSALVLHVGLFFAVITLPPYVAGSFDVSERTVATFAFHIFYTLLGLMFSLVQKKDFSWFVQSDGLPLHSLYLAIGLFLSNRIFWRLFALWLNS